jgi:hypothetical protein
MVRRNFTTQTFFLQHIPPLHHTVYSSPRMTATFSLILLIFDLISSPAWALLADLDDPTVGCWRFVAGVLVRSYSSAKGGILERIRVGLIKEVVNVRLADSVALVQLALMIGMAVGLKVGVTVGLTVGLEVGVTVGLVEKLL